MPQMTVTVHSGGPGIPIQASLNADLTLHQALPLTQSVHSFTLLYRNVAQGQTSSSPEAEFLLWLSVSWATCKFEVKGKQ